MYETTNEFHIADASHGDIEKIAEIENQSFSSPASVGDFESLLANENTVFICAKCSHELQALYDDRIYTAGEGSISGFAIMLCVPASFSESDNSIVFGCADIVDVAVSHALRRRGLGRLLMEKLITEAKQKFVSTVMLEVRKSNAAARSLYSSLGFREVGIRKNYYSLPREDAILMNLEISPDEMIGFDFNRV